MWPNWLKAQRLDLDAELSAIAQNEQVPWRRVAPVATALRDIARRDGTEALRVRLMNMVDDAGSNDSDAFRVVEATLAKVANARPYIAVLRRMIDFTTRADEAIGDSLLFWGSVAIPLDQRMELLQRLIWIDDDYYWRPKDWANLPAPLNRLSFSALSYQLVRQEPIAGFPALQPWLDNVTSLNGGESTVADVAMGILYRLRNQQPRRVWSAIANGGSRCDRLLYRLAASGSRVARICCQR